MAPHDYGMTDGRWKVGRLAYEQQHGVNMVTDPPQHRRNDGHGHGHGNYDVMKASAISDNHWRLWKSSANWIAFVWGQGR